MLTICEGEKWRTVEGKERSLFSRLASSQVRILKFKYAVIALPPLTSTHTHIKHTYTHVAKWKFTKVS